VSEVTEGNILCWHNFLVLRYKSAKTYISFGFNLKTGTVKYNGPNFSTVFFVPQWDFSRRVKGNGPFNRNYHEVILTRKFREHSELYVFNYFGFCLATVFQCEFTSECDLVLPVYSPNRKYASLMCLFGSKLQVPVKPEKTHAN
jgi:hypothetical protein